MQRQDFATKTDGGIRRIDLLAEQLGDLFIRAPGRLLVKGRPDHRNIIAEELPQSFLSIFRPRARFLEIADTYMEESFRGPAVAAHVRRGDYKKGKTCLRDCLGAVEQLAGDGQQIF